MKYFLGFFFFVLSGCKSCVHSFYGTNGSIYLNLKFENSKINGAFFKYYIDTVFNKEVAISDSIKSLFYLNNLQHDLLENQRLIHFKSSPEEWYLIGFEIEPCWIESIYNRSLSDSRIGDINMLSKSEIERIKNRFDTGIIKKVELYAKQRNIPDSIVYSH